MKKNLLLLAFMISYGFHSQNWCATDWVQAELEAKNPSVKKAKEEAEARLLVAGVQNYLKKIGATNSSTGKQVTSTMYEIPVVIHIIVPTGAAIGSAYNRSDVEIETWINNTNKIFATTYGNGFYPEGTGSNGGTVIPVKLVLAKRNPQCSGTTGIIRYDGGTLTDYNNYGVNKGGTSGSGVTIDQIRTLAPHWPESSYFNIYIINKVNGDPDYGIMGWCGYPANPDSDYDSFMKSKVVTLAGNTTFPHEFGHGMGLLHTFYPLDSNGVCPTNTDCAVDNDKVCDTAPVQTLGNVSPTPSNTDTNACTTSNYDGTQYNIMGYSQSRLKFTPGQRDRALAQFLSLRGSLTTSLGATNLANATGGGTLVAASCVPTAATNLTTYQVGPTFVKIGTINVKSQGLNTATNGGQFYADYSSLNCLNKSVYTELPVSALQNIQVNFIGNPQSIRVWIDYNNNGIFETSELATSVNKYAVTGGTTTDTVWNSTFTAPPTTVLNTPLRMRIKSDFGSNLALSTNACTNPDYGQVEDYVVIFKSSPTLGNSEILSSPKLVTIYPNPTNNGNFFIKLNTDSQNIKVEISDASGRIVSKPELNFNNGIININSHLSRGVYFIKIQTDNKVQVEKLIVEK